MIKILLVEDDKSIVSSLTVLYNYVFPEFSDDDINDLAAVNIINKF